MSSHADTEARALSFDFNGPAESVPLLQNLLIGFSHSPLIPASDPGKPCDDFPARLKAFVLS
jgi:hypothetical protein